MKYLGLVIIALWTILFAEWQNAGCALFSMLTACVSVYVCHRYYGNVFSPISLFSVGWLVPASTVIFLPNHFRFAGWKIEPELWIAVFLGFLSFVAGSMCFSIFIDKRSYNRAKSLRSAASGEDVFSEKQRYEKLIWAFFIIGMLGFMLNINNVISAGGLSLYFKLGFRDVESIFGQSTIVNYLYFMNPLVMLLGAIYQTRFGFRRDLCLIMFLSFISLFFLGIKSILIYPAVMTLLAYVYSRYRFPISTVLITLVIVIVFFQFVTIGRNYPYLVDQNMNWFEILTYHLDDMFLYFTPGYANLQDEMLYFKGRSYGEESFGFLVDIYRFILGTRVKGGELDSLSEGFYMFNDAYNTGTFMREHYRDFGYIGIFLFPFMYGLISTLFYKNYLSSPTIKNIAVYAVVSIMLIFSYFSNQYFRIQYWYWIIVILLTGFTGFKIKNDKENMPAVNQ